MLVPGEHGSGLGRDGGTVYPNQTCPPEMLPKGSRTPAQEPQRGRRQPHQEPLSPGAAAEGSASPPAFLASPPAFGQPMVAGCSRISGSIINAREGQPLPHDCGAGDPREGSGASAPAWGPPGPRPSGATTSPQPAQAGPSLLPQVTDPRSLDPRPHQPGPCGLPGPQAAAAELFSPRHPRATLPCCSPPASQCLWLNRDQKC